MASTSFYIMKHFVSETTNRRRDAAAIGRTNLLDEFEEEMMDDDDEGNWEDSSSDDDESDDNSDDENMEMIERCKLCFSPDATRRRDEESLSYDCETSNMLQQQFLQYLQDADKEVHLQQAPVAAAMF